MTFYWPHMLWLLFAPAALLAWEILRGKKADAEAHPKIFRAEAGPGALRISDFRFQISNWRRARWWLAGGLILTILALARPQWGRIEEPVFGQSREIMLALDLSQSMNSPDVPPSRLARGKLLIESLLDHLQGERVGMIVFAGRSFLPCPLGPDYEVLRQFLPLLDTNFLPDGGTNYRDLLQTALDSFSTDGGADRYLIVLSDGEATDDNDWRPLVDNLKKKNIHVIGLGVGTEKGSLIPDGAGGFVKDEQGAAVMSRLENATLRELAEKTGGTYTDASKWVDLPALLKSSIEAGHQGSFRETTRVHYAERFQWVLAPAMVCFLISFWLEFPVHPRARNLKLERAAGRPPETSVVRQKHASIGAEVAALWLLLGFGWLAPGGFGLNARADDANDTYAAPLADAVKHIAEHESNTAEDWANLAKVTVKYGERLQGIQQPVPAGPVGDALAAVDAGEAIDPNAADWATLRRELQALKRKAEEKKPPPQQQQKQSPPQQKQPQQSQKSNSAANQQQSQPNPSSGGQSQQNQAQQSQGGQSGQNQQQQTAGQQPQPNQSQSAQQNSNGQSGQNQQKDAYGQQSQPSQPQPQQNNGGQNQSNAAQNPSDGLQPQEASSGLPKNDKPLGALAFGKMDEPSSSKKSESNPQTGQAREMQKFGGVPEKKTDAATQDPALTVPLQKLEQINQEDNPAALQLRLRDDKGSPPPNGKNW